MYQWLTFVVCILFLLDRTLYTIMGETERRALGGMVLTDKQDIFNHREQTTKGS